MDADIKGVKKILNLIGDFEFHDFTEIRWIMIANNYKKNDEHKFPDIKMRISNEEQNCTIEILFKKADEVKIKNFQQVLGFDIVDVSDKGWSFLNYDIIDIEYRDISFRCNDVEIINAVKGLK